jgi:hypothetical protein
MRTETDTAQHVTYSYEDVPTVLRFAQSEKRFRAIVGPFGSGKSSGCLWELIRRGQEQHPHKDGIRRSKWAIIRNTYPQLKDTTMETVFDWFPPRYFGQYKVADHNYYINHFDRCEILFMFRALDKPEHVSNLLSMELTGAWINEAREVPWAIIEALDGRIGRYPATKDVGLWRCKACGSIQETEGICLACTSVLLDRTGCTYRGMIMDTNPPDEDTDFYRFFELEKPDNAAIFHQPSGLAANAENLTHLDGGRGYYSELAKGKSKEYIDVYIHGKYGYVKEGKPIYETSWNDTLHVAPYSLQPVLGKELIIGFDFGLTPCAIITQITPRGYLNVLDELTTSSMGLERFLQNILAPLLNVKYRNYKVLAVGDPAGTQRAPTDERTCFDLLRQYNFDVYPAASNTITARIGAVETFLSRLTDGKPTLQLDPSCRMLRKGFNGGYHRKKIRTTGGERYSDDPYKNIYSHPHDALQYACLFIVSSIQKSQRDQYANAGKYRKPYRVPTRAGY